MKEIKSTFKKSGSFSVLVYVKYTKTEDITDFVNIDWNSFDLSNVTLSSIDVNFDQELVFKRSSSSGTIYMAKGKSEQNDDIIMLRHFGNSYNIIGTSPIMQFDGDIYYIPYLHFKKMLEVTLVNIDKLPNDKLEKLYIKQIETIAEQIHSQMDLAIDIRDAVGIESEIFWYQDKTNLTKFMFGKLYTNKILSIFENKSYSYYLRKYLNDKNDFEVFNSYFVEKLTKSEYKNLPYMEDYTSKIQPYNYIYYSNYNKVYILEDSIENRIRAHLLNNVFNSSPYYYDFEGSKYLYEFNDNGFTGNITYRTISSSSYELEDIVKCQ